MTHYRRSRQEFVSQLISLVFCLVTAGLVLSLSEEYFWPWAVLAGGSFLILGGFFAFRIFLSLERIELSGTEGGFHLKVRRFFRMKTQPMEEVTRVQVFPAWGKTILSSGTRKLVLHHQLMRFDSLLAELERARPDLFVTEEVPLVLKASKVGFLLLGFFSLAVAAAGVVLSQISVLLLYPALFFALFPLVRLVWFTPRRYTIAPGRLELHYLFRKRVLTGSGLRRITEDVYAASGCHFFVLVLSYAGEKIVLDEGQLLHPVRRHAAWIRTALFPEVF